MRALLLRLMTCKLTRFPIVGETVPSMLLDEILKYVSDVSEYTLVGIVPMNSKINSI